MQRRHFLGGLLGAGAASAAGVSIAKPKTGVLWRTVCMMDHCRAELEQFVDLSGPVVVGTQCPRCLAALDTSGLAEQIRAFNRQDKWGRPL